MNVVCNKISPLTLFCSVEEKFVAENLTVTELLKKLNDFYGTQKLLTTFTINRQFFLYKVRRI